METWRHVWRDGFALVLSGEALEALATALREDDPRLIQGATSQPPPLMCVQDWLVEAGCAVGYCGAAVSGGLACTLEEARAAGGGQVPHTNPHAAPVGAVEEFFARACFDADQLLGTDGACRGFLTWFDATPRHQMRLELLAEVELALAAGKGAAA